MPDLLTALSSTLPSAAVLLLAISASPVLASPVMRVLRAQDSQAPNLLANAAFEQGDAKAATSWEPWHSGFRCEASAGRKDSRAIVCEGAEGGEQHGAGQSVSLNQQTPAPIIVRGWSKAENVSGSPDSGYSLYVDLTYADGTPLWGQTTDFGTGSHDWQQRELLIVPEKPVASLNVYCLFRGHTGRAWFDDVHLSQAVVPSGTALVDGVAVAPVQSAAPASGLIQARTGDGLAVGYHAASARIAEVRIGDRDVTAIGAPGGFMARDAAADSDWHGFNNGSCPELSLRLEVSLSAKPTYIELDGRLVDTTGRDRAVTLMFALPIGARGWQWGESIRTARQIGGSGEYTTVVRMGTGATGTMAQYPFSCIADAQSGLSLGIDMAAPAQYRLAYNAGTQQFFIAYDFGLVGDGHPEAQPKDLAGGDGKARGNGKVLRFAQDDGERPSGAHFRFVLYRVDPVWGFRSAAKRYYELFPTFFACRSKQQGIWMPFTDVSTVEGWQDFGFRYHEGINNVPFDDQADILSFRYTEPSTFWMAMPKEMPRTHDAAMAELQRLAAGGDARRQREAQAVLAAGSQDEDGRFQMLFRDTPWCDGAVFSLSPLPGIPGEWTDAKIAWNAELKEQLYGPGAKGQQDGEYLDSLEAYVTADQNFRREHFRVATLPLTFSMVTKRPVIHKALAIYEFVRWISDDVHGMGKLMMANSVPSRFPFLSGYLDLMGTETNWVPGGKWQPMSHSSMALRRTMCYQKPYLFLMNSDFDALEPHVERYFQRSLFYGFFPSMFSPVASSGTGAYWRTPRWYNRDRELFKRYLPIIKRVAEAGWEPVTHATADNDAFLIERFGPDEEGRVYFTVMNGGGDRGRGTVHVETKELGLAKGVKAREMVSGREVGLKAAGDELEFEVELEAEEGAAVELCG